MTSDSLWFPAYDRLVLVTGLLEGG